MTTTLLESGSTGGVPAIRQAPQVKFLKALRRQLSRTLSALDKVDHTTPLDFNDRLRLEELERAISYLKHQRGWAVEDKEPHNGRNQR